MSTTRRRRIRAHNEQLRAREMDRGRGETARVERIQQPNDAVTRLMAWTAMAILVLVAVLILVA